VTLVAGSPSPFTESDDSLLQVTSIQSVAVTSQPGMSAFVRAVIVRGMRMSFTVATAITRGTVFCVQGSSSTPSACTITITRTLVGGAEVVTTATTTGTYSTLTGATGTPTLFVTSGDHITAHTGTKVTAIKFETTTPNFVAVDTFNFYV
jgi:hypothetical protein